jgi:hypothetical protein
MIYIKDHKQTEIFDPWSFLSTKRRHLLDQSWAGLFKEEILCELPVRELAAFFTDGFGRPTKELHTILGVLILQQTNDLTDEESVNQLAFNIQWHYALNITEESDTAKYISLKTLWNARHLVVENDLSKTIFDAVTDKLGKVFKVNTDIQRIDSVHIKSNMRRLGRIRIFTETIHKFLVNLKRGHHHLFDTIDEKITGKYLYEKAMECFSRIKPSQSRKTLSEVSKDLFDLVEQFKSCTEVAAMSSYKLLERVLKEQCNLTEDKDNPVELKKPKEISSDSLQNPSDTDATYSGHKGQGYQAQIMETYCKDEEARDKTLNLITLVDVEPAHQSDANALIPALESVKDNNHAPEEVLADSLYGSDENCQTATKDFDVEVIAPTMGSAPKDSIHLSDFATSDEGEIISCPEGHAPVMKKIKKTRNTVAFDIDKCSNCPNQKNCPVKQGKKCYYLRYTDKEMRIAKRRAYEQTEEFKDRYRWRAGIEATMSEYDRRTGVKQLRVRGLKAVRFCATLKAIGVNIFRATAVRVARIIPVEGLCEA